MRVSFSEQIDGGRILYALGKVSAASEWHASGSTRVGCEDAALRALIASAEDVDADAIVGVGYEVDGARYSDLADIAMERVRATGIAVKLASA